jgi:tRNA-specific 2-thiouridylase
MSRSEDKCCGPQAIADARMVAQTLDITHYVLDEVESFDKVVIQYFAHEYHAGRTPNPCIMCNEKLKFGNLWQKAEDLGASFIATGHYAIVEHSDSNSRLRKGLDMSKDQSYFLFSLPLEKLKHALFPLGQLTKLEIRKIARELGLVVADKKDSQEICFVPGKDYKKFLKERGEILTPGEFYTQDGQCLGQHEGIELFTIGQRKGLPPSRYKNIAYYVVEINHLNGRVILGTKDDLSCSSFLVNHVNWLDYFSDDVEYSVKVRHGVNSYPVKIVQEEDKNSIKVVSPGTIPAVTPGQAAVFYDGDRVIGGGWINKRLTM